MDDAWNNLFSLVFGFVPDLAFLTEIWNLAHFFLSFNFLNQLDCHKACNLLNLCDVWIQCVDIPEFVW